MPPVTHRGRGLSTKPKSQQSASRIFYLSAGLGLLTVGTKAGIAIPAGFMAVLSPYRLLVSASAIDIGLLEGDSKDPRYERLFVPGGSQSLPGSRDRFSCFGFSLFWRDRPPRLDRCRSQRHTHRESLARKPTGQPVHRCRLSCLQPEDGLRHLRPGVQFADGKSRRIQGQYRQRLRVCRYPRRVQPTPMVLNVPSPL